VESDARRLRQEIDDAAFAFLEACFADGPGVFLCEDAHWFDEQTHEFVKRAVQQLPPGVLTVVTARDPQVVPKGSRVTTIALTPLEREDALDLVMALQPDGRSLEEMLEIVNRSDGVPLFLEELVRVPTAAAPLSAVPDVLYEPLVARLNLTPDGATVAAAAAAIAGETDRAMLALVSEIEGAELDVALQALVDAHILVRSEDGQFRFRHELLRLVASDLQPPTRRQALHGRVAAALVADGVDSETVDWQRVADHLVAAGQASRAADAYERASELARRRGALVEARLLLTQAIDALADGPEATFGRQAALRLGRAYISLSLEGSQSAAAAADYEHCLEMLVGQPVGDEMIMTLLALWSYYAARAEFDKADELLDAMRASGPLPPIIEALIDGAYATVAFYRGDHIRSRELWRRQRSRLANMAEADFTRQWFVPLDPIVIAQTSEIWSRIMTGDFAGALPLIERARAMSAGLPFPRGPFTLAAFLSFAAWFHFEVGDYEGALRVNAEMAEIAGRHGFDTWAIIAATQREVFVGLEEVRAADGVIDDPAAFSALAATIGRYMAMWKMVDQYLFMPYYLTAQAIFHHAAGEEDLAVAALEEARSIAERTGMKFYEPETIRFLARMRATPDEQAVGFRAAIELAQAQGALMYEMHAALDLARVSGDLSEVTRLLGEFPESVSFPALADARELVRRSSATR
jgi:tetratricopeptide (TPR) repeat protein